MKTILFGSFITASLFISGITNAQTGTKEKVPVSDGAVVPAKDIVVNLSNSKDHSTLLAAVKAADMVEILQSAGPFTLFSPTNAAFDLLPAGSVAALLKTENKGNLNIILKYHIVPGKLTMADLLKLVENGNGSATLTTMQRKTLYISAEGNKLSIRDEKGGVSVISGKESPQSNGVMYVIDHVLLPKDL